MLLFIFHGEGILFGFLAHLFFGVVAAASLLYGLVRYKSKLGILLVSIYLLPTLVAGSLLRDGVRDEGPQFFAHLLTLPWNRIVPCDGLDSSCPMTVGVLLVCAGLNSAALYYLGAWLSRRARHPPSLA